MLHAAKVPIAQTEFINAIDELSRVEHAQGQLLPVQAWDDGKAQIDLALPMLEGEPCFVGIELCYRVNSGKALELIDEPVSLLGRQNRGIAHDAVDAQPHVESPAIRVEMHVGRPLADGVANDRMSGGRSICRALMLFSCAERFEQLACQLRMDRSLWLGAGSWFAV